MAISEVFQNPTVKHVIFQIRFPNLFYIENKIGEIQMRIMEEYPESKLLFRQQLVFADIGPDVKIDNANEAKEQHSKKIWQFKSPQKIELNIMSDSLDINSQFHKTYKNPGATHKFRDAIGFVLNHFLEITQIPLISRIGLRYIDECPIFKRDNESFKNYYNSTFPLDRFPIENSDEMLLKAVIRKGEYFIRYLEALRPPNENQAVILDFDAYKNNIKAKDFLTVTDTLHELISEEFERTVKQPLIDYMRKPKED